MSLRLLSFCVVLSQAEANTCEHAKDSYCRARLREECVPPHRTCGPCLPNSASHVQAEHANTPCEAVGDTRGTMGEIPIIDAMKMRLGGSEGLAEMENFKRALFGPGFFYLANTGVKYEAVFEEMRRFFSQSLEEKMQYVLSDDPSGSGYITNEILDDDSQRPDPKESYDMDWPHVSSSIWNNTAVSSYWHDVQSLKDLVFSGYEAALGLEPGLFMPMHNGEFDYVRLQHYPPVDSSSGATQRAGPHSDYGSFTLLIQDSVGGLQILDRISGRWVDATPIPGTVLCNTGDFMMRWANDHVPSTLHRVAEPLKQNANGMSSTQDRYTLVYFVIPNRKQVVTNLMVDEPALYPPVISEDYVMERLSSNFACLLGTNESQECS